MYPLRMIWIIVETLLVVGGIFAFNHYLRKGIESDLSHRDPLNEMYLRAESEGDTEGFKMVEPEPESKNLPKY